MQMQILRKWVFRKIAEADRELDNTQDVGRIDSFLMQSMSKERSTRTGEMPEMVLQVYFEVSTSLSLRYSARL